MSVIKQLQRKVHVAFRRVPPEDLDLSFNGEIYVTYPSITDPSG